MIKKCNKCGIEKELIQFNRKNNGYQSFCKECNSTYLKQHYVNNKKYYINKNNKRKYVISNWFKKFKSTLKCEICGENDIACLDFHHIDKNEKEYNIAYLSKFGSLSKLKNEISKCKVLCSNCHRKLHYIAS